MAARTAGGGGGGNACMAMRRAGGLTAGGGCWNVFLPVVGGVISTCATLAWNLTSEHEPTAAITS